MAPIWRWILAMVGSAFVLLAGLFTVLLGSPEMALYGWFILFIGVIALTINYMMRNQFR